VADRFDLDALDDDPFEIDAQAAHLFKHPNLGLHDSYDVWVATRSSTQPRHRHTG
jgi:hypothetical protein